MIHERVVLGALVLDKGSKVFAKRALDMEGESVARVEVSVGRPWSEAAFTDAALKCFHPIDTTQALQPAHYKAVFVALTEGAEYVALHRASVIQKYTKMANSLQAKEAELHQAVPQHGRRIIQHKRVLLLRQMMLDADCGDRFLHHEVAVGCRIVG